MDDIPYNDHLDENKGFGCMMFYAGLIFLVIAVSLDGFGVGVTYGIRKIHVPLHALSIIMLCSGLVVLFSMTMGSMFSAFISPQLAKILGGCILISLGIFSLYRMIQSKVISSDDHQKTDRKKHRFKTVLTNPNQADLDASGVISTNEALLLGIALALDAFGAGLGASIIGYSPLLTTVLISCMSGLFVYSGLKTGLMLSKNKHLQQMSFIPPLLLIVLGIYNIF